MPEEKRPFIVHVISHTHWDREWRWPIWESRARLIEFFDELIEVLERDPRYRNFTVDGQACLVEDYLEMRPERRERVRKLVREGRIAIGPWFTLPDLYPVGGECLVRNLLRGMRISESLGGALRIGYTTFGWGQTAQMPQLYAGFGIDSIITAKNVSKERAPHCEFIWRAPDGTEAFTTRLGDLARANFYKRGILKLIHGDQFWTEAWHYRWAEGSLIFHRADEDACHADYLQIDPRHAFHAEHVNEAFEQTWPTTLDSLSPHRFFGDGCDFTGALAPLPEIIAELNRSREDCEFRHGTLAEYMEALRATVPREQLRVVEGELRDPPVTAMSGNALSTRLYIKQRNRAAQNRLIGVAEPMACIDAMLGREYPAAFLEKAWQYLLLSHNHDAINGVTVDKVAEDVMYRLNQVLEISDVVADNAFIHLIERIDLSKFAPADVLLVIFNPLSHVRREVVQVAVDTPAEQNVGGIRIERASGGICPTQTISRESRQVPVQELHARPRPFYSERHHVYLDTGELPACGYAVFKVCADRALDRTLSMLEEPIDLGTQLRDGGRAMENEHVRVAFNGDGSFDLHDKKTDAWYRGLNVFEDAGDNGDYWHRRPPQHNEIHFSRGSQARVWIERDGQLVTTICAEITMRIPKFVDRESGRRSSETARLAIRSAVTLRAGERRVEVKTTFDNEAEDHRLRVLFPTYLRTDASDAEGHFCVDRRPIALERDARGRGPGEMKTLPQQAFVDLSDGVKGLAILNKGMTEFEVSEDESRTIAVTLLRAVPMKICTEWRTPTFFAHHKGGQCLGRQTLEYAIYPHDGNWIAGNVARESERYCLPPRAAQTRRHDKGNLPCELSFLSIEPASIRLSAFKRAESGREGEYCLRLYNPTGEAANAIVNCHLPIHCVRLANLNEEAQNALPHDARSITVTIEPCKIVTLLVELG